jgi:large subunit ribosomal protein L9
MEVILLENLGKLGSIGDKAKVKAGYGRNYLVPQGKAVFATEKNLADFELRRADLEAAAVAKLAEANARAAKVTEIGSLTITAIAGDEGKLFGSVGTRELEDALNAAGAEVSKSEINLPEGALRNVGEYSVEVQLHTEVTASITVVIEAE